MVMAFPNLYYKRTAATAKACYICYKPTVTVLATIDTADFLYTCPVHLTDRGFATRAPDPDPEPKKPSPSPEEIAKVKREWEEKQRQKKEKVQGKEGGQSQVDGDGKNTTGGAHEDADQRKQADVWESTNGKQATVKPDESAIVNPNALLSEGPTSKPTHERYILHRDIFALRTADHRRRIQAAQTKDLAPRLPGAPRSLIP